jgi:glycerol-3-phosphate dehydrogenase (NAD(P)+)
VDSHGKPTGERPTKTASIGVIGAGSWGTAIADLLSRNGHPVELWAFESEIAMLVNEHHENKVFLPGIALSTRLFCTNDLCRAAAGKGILILAVPSNYVRGVCADLLGRIDPETIVVSVTKGIENETLFTMSRVLKEALSLSDERVAVLSGPSFGVEVADSDEVGR